MSGGDTILLSMNIYWAAGFLEGEGSFCYSAQTLRVSAPQKELWPLELLVNLWGGAIYGPTEAGVSSWVVCGEKAREIMLLVRPLLSPRRQNQIDKVIRDRGEPKHNRDKTHCKHGHPFSGDNLRMRIQKNGNPRRICVTCHDGWMKKARSNGHVK